MSDLYFELASISKNRISKFYLISYNNACKADRKCLLITETVPLKVVDPLNMTFVF